MRRALWAGEAGNLAMILPMIMATAIGGALLWNYNSWRTTTTKGTRSGLDLRVIGLNILNRTKTVLAAPGKDITTTVLNKCGAPSSINTDLATFRNLSAAPPGNPVGSASYSYTYSFNPAVGTLGPTCLLLDTELPATTELSTAVLTVTWVPDSDDLINLSRKVDISVHVVFDPTVTGATSQEQAQVFDIDEVVTLQAASLAGYGVVLYGTPATQSIVAGLPTTFLSPVYDATVGPVVTLANVVNNLGSVTFNKRFDMAARALGQGATAVNMTTMNRSFPGGIKNLVYSLPASSNNPETSQLPIDGQNQTGDKGPTGTAWTQTVFLDESGGSLMPIPYLNVAANGEPGAAALGLPGNPAAPWVGPGYVNVLGGGVVPAGTGWAGLNQSCTRGSSQAIVYVQTPTGLPTSTFSLSLNAATNDNMVCGFIAADAVTITVSGNGPVYFFGMIMTRNLTVVNGGGNGSLFIGNPYRDDLGIVEPAGGPANYSFADMRNQFALESQVGMARNFFVPILRYPPPPSDRAVRFRPTGMLSIWETIGAPGELQIPGTIYPCTTPASNMESPTCGTESATGFQAPYTAGAGSTIFSYRSLSGAAAANKTDLWFSANDADNIVFKVIDP